MYKRLLLMVTFWAINMFASNLYCNLIKKCTICAVSLIRKTSTGRFMNKVLKDTKSKKKWQNRDRISSEIVPLPKNLAEGASEGKKSINSRRVSVLNKVFMRYITDLMANGSSASVLLGRGIEINRVKVTPDFHGVNVYWIAKGTENDNEVEHLLNQNAGNLRHELSQLRVMGVVPKINFIKDKEYAKLIEVDERLAKADFGEDYVPVEPSYKFKHFPEISPHFIEKSNGIDVDPPQMRNDVFGLNHTQIMSKVLKGMKKSCATHRNTTYVPTTVNEEPIEYTHKEQKKIFQKFLLKRQIQSRKKERDKYNPEYEYFQTEKIKYEEPSIEEIKDLDDYIEENTK